MLAKRGEVDRAEHKAGWSGVGVSVDPTYLTCSGDLPAEDQKTLDQVKMEYVVKNTERNVSRSHYPSNIDAQYPKPKRSTRLFENILQLNPTLQVDCLKDKKKNRTFIGKILEASFKQKHK
ncbi:unnamed protein product [Cyprideis torosa]|uniref:Uncharacterized protein n=1 Tax=Cyprideis torosa TaxID=163714 RepID=A0A7R8WNV9_9CRUS|nr:unnamed protein product [Cyprideis torosa]CAG0901083.1 unnamed protein product [Cyprideis torosa]